MTLSVAFAFADNDNDDNGDNDDNDDNDDQAGADTGPTDKDGLMALHCAASRGHTECIQTLVGHHSDHHDKDVCEWDFSAFCCR